MADDGERADWLLLVGINGESPRDRLVRVAGADTDRLPVRERMAVLKARQDLGWDINQRFEMD